MDGKSFAYAVHEVQIAWAEGGGPRSDLRFIGTLGKAALHAAVVETYRRDGPAYMHGFLVATACASPEDYSPIAWHAARPLYCKPSMCVEFRLDDSNELVPPERLAFQLMYDGVATELQPWQTQAE